MVASSAAASRRRQGARLERIARARWRGPGGIRGLSHAIGVSRATLYSWFRGDTAPDMATITDLARALETSPSQLVGALGAHDPATVLESRPVAGPRATDLSMELRIGDVLAPQEVTWCGADDPIGPVAHRIYEEDFSQMPVRDRGRWMGLLTAETIARWMAGRSTRSLDVDERAPVREVLSYAEDPTNYSLVGSNAPVSEVLSAFERSAGRGRPLSAVLVVAGGRPEGQIEGIVTPYDLPALKEARRLRDFPALESGAGVN